MLRKIKIATMISLALIGSACSIQTPEIKTVDKIIYKTTPLTLPNRPVLPTWTGNDMECLSEEMKQKIRDRDTNRREYSEQLETIIQSTWK
jgi:hypothetical protein